MRQIKIFLIFITYFLSANLSIAQVTLPPNEYDLDTPGCCQINILECEDMGSEALCKIIHGESATFTPGATCDDGLCIMGTGALGIPDPELTFGDLPQWLLDIFESGTGTPPDGSSTGSGDNETCNPAENTQTLTKGSLSFEVTATADCDCIDESCIIDLESVDFSPISGGDSNGYSWYRTQFISDPDNPNKCVSMRYEVYLHSEHLGPVYAVVCCESKACSEAAGEKSSQTFDDNPLVQKIIPIETKINLHPNPAKTNINLSINSITSEEIQVQIYTITGRLIHEESFYVIKGKYQKQIILPEEITNGLYLLRAKIGTEEFTEKFIVAN